jgi:uncharacterized membrane protein YjgN (DUF898 family)
MDTRNPEIPAAEGQGPQTRHRFSFFGRGGTLFGIQIVNLLLIFVTLGIYWFWGKARVRRYLWGQIDVAGDRLSYHGTGGETIRGWIRAFLIFGIPFFIAQNLPFILGAPLPLQWVGGLLSLVLIGLFMPFAMVGMRRYRYSRTALRGIRFSWRGRWLDFAKRYIQWKALVFVTFGLYAPYSDMYCADYLIHRTYFGNRPFGFDGKGKDLIGSYLLALVLALPTLLISLIWYVYRKRTYTWNHTTFETARFRSTITFGGLMGLYGVNALLLICTLGFAAPWARVRSLRYHLSNLSLEGPTDLASVVQEAQEATATSDEVGGWLDADMDFG